MIKFIVQLFRSYSDQQKPQNKLNVLIGKQKKEDYIKIRITKNQLRMIEQLAIYGISDWIVLNKILRRNLRKH